MHILGAVTVVVGGASGLGEGTTRYFHSLGSRVMVVDLNEARGRAVVAELGERAAFARADILATEQLQAAVEYAMATFGAIHVLVNTAAIGSAARTLSRFGPHDIDYFKKVVAVNLTGTFDAVRLAATKMVANEPNESGERGVIVNTASGSAFEGQVGQVAYAGSKAGVVGMTLPIARDLASLGIRICTIAPGMFETPMLLSTFPPADKVPAAKVKEILGKRTPFPQRLGRPEEYAFLVQQIVENPMLNGETIRLDGALRLRPRF